MNGGKSIYSQSHIVGRRNAGPGALPRERAAACIVTRNRNQESVRQERLAKKEAADAKRRDAKHTNIAPTGRGSARQTVGRSHLSTSISAEPKLVSNEGAQSIERNRKQEVSKRATSGDGMKMQSAQMSSSEAIIQEEIAEPKSTTDDCDFPESGGRSELVRDDPDIWEEKPTVHWNEETMNVLHHWSSSQEGNNDEQAVLELDFKSPEGICEEAVPKVS